MTNQKRGQWVERTAIGALPCPFCGHGTPVIQRELREGFRPTSRDPERFIYSLRCLACAIIGPWKGSDSSALQWWNIRVNQSKGTVVSTKVIHVTQYHTVVGDPNPTKVASETVLPIDQTIAEAPEGTYKFRRFAFQTAMVEINGQQYEMICAQPVAKSSWWYMKSCRPATVEELLILGEIVVSAKLSRGEIVVMHVPGGMVEAVKPGTVILLPQHQQL